VFTCYRVTSIEYYEKRAAEAERDAVREPNPGDLQYYHDNGASERPGQWWASAGWSGQINGVVDGGEIDVGSLRNLAQGIDPETGAALIQQTKAQRTVGYDCQMAAPKTVSVLWAVADERARGRIEQIHADAVRAALDWAQEQGLVITRRGSGGGIHEAVREVAAATYLHTTSRAGDPQLHSHAVIVNICVRADGSTGTIDNIDLLNYQGAIGAYYRTALASGLREEFGWQPIRKERNFEIAGIGDNLVSMFSKRRMQIEEIAEARGYDTATSREAAQYANLASRGTKDDLAPLEDLERDWHRQIVDEGLDYAAIWEQAEEGARQFHSSRPSILPHETPEQRQDRILLVAFETLLATSTVVEERHLLQTAFEALQCEVDAPSATRAIERLSSSGLLVELGRHKDRPVYTTQSMIDLETGMIAAAVARRGEREFVPSERVEAALAKRPTMSAEQMDAVRHALNTDGVAVVEGHAGSGKSFSSGAIAEAAREAGLEVHTIAPSWKATEVVRSDTDTTEEMARAVAKFLHEARSGDRHIGRNSVIILDEGGMVGLREMAEIARIAEEAGAKLVIAGDTRQLKPVAAGAPMELLRQHLGSSEITEIRRQKEGWMRQASTDLATGNIEAAVDLYDKAGKVRWVSGRDETFAALARDWVEDVRQRPDESRIVLARRNADVNRLNELLRAEYAALGKLGDEAVTIKAVARGNGGAAVDLELRVGDRVIFGEGVNVRGHRINNADLATVVAVSGGRDPVLTVRLDKGAEVSARATEFAGWRPDGEAPVPRIQYALATSIHASQGATVDRTFVAESGGMGRESLYVAMTRHRQDARLYVETARIEDTLSSRKGVTVAASRTGASIPDAGDVDRLAATQNDIKRYAVATWSSAETKRNVTDFAKLDLKAPAAARVMLEHLRAGRHAILDRSTPGGPQIRLERQSQIPVSDRAAPAVPPAARVPMIRQAPPTAGRSAPEAPQSVPPRLQAAFERGRELARSGVVPPRQSLRISDDEKAKFLKTDLAEFAQAHGYRIDSSYSHRGQIGRDPVKIDGRSQLGWRLVAPNGDKLVIAPGSNHDMFFNWSRKDQQGWSGNILTFTNSELGLKKPGENLHYLRDKLGTGPKTSSAQPAFRERVEQESTPAIVDPTRIRRTWSKMEPGHNSRYLIEERGLRPELLAQFRATIRTEPESWTKSSNRGGVAFAHVDEEGRICGYERKGWGIQSEGKRSFSQFSANGSKTLALHGDTRAPGHVVIAENSIDGMSYVQHAGIKGNVLVVSTCGNPSAQALDLLARKASEFKSAKFEIARDADKGGEAWTGAIKAAIHLGAPDAKVAVRAPEDRYKDWNNQIRGLSRTDEVSRNKARLAEAPSAPPSSSDDKRAKPQQTERHVPKL
jgi:conjugative relaxase-like TrwC/TraI family protein